MDHQDMHHERRFKLRYIFLGLFLVLMVWFGVFRLRTRTQLNHRIDALRAKGYPMSLTELDNWYADTLPPGAGNAAPYYLDAFASYVKWSENDANDLPFVGRTSRPRRAAALDASTLQLARDFLTDHQETLDLLFEAAEIPYCLYPMEFSQGYNMILPWLSDARQCTQMLCLNTLVSTHEGDIQAAITSLKVTFALGNSVNGPLLVQRLVQVAIRSLTYSTLEQVLSRIALTETQLSELTDIISACETDQGYKDSLVGERCFGLYSFSLSPSEMSMLSSPNNGHQGLVMLMLIPRKILGFHDKDTLSYVNLMQAYIDTQSLPYDQGLIRCQEIDQSLGNPQNMGLIARMLMPALGRTFQLQVRNIAHTRTVLTVLAVERHRLSQGKLPETLNELVPTYLDSVPKDPFDRQDLRYQLLKTGYVVYSIGQDLSDDNGKERERQRGSQEHPWDVTFIVER